VRGRGDGGSITAWFAVVSVGLLLLVGLMADGAGVLAARANVFSLALAAAREGAQELNGQAEANGDIELDPQAASARVLDYLAARHQQGTVSVRVDVVTVTVTSNVGLRFTSLGVGSVDVSGTASARAQKRGGQ
jgi:Flp pilus assembly protein TadG